MLWKKKSRFDDFAPLGWMMLGAISALTLVSLVNSLPEEKVNYTIKKMTESTAKVAENIRKGYENMLENTEIREMNIDSKVSNDNPKIKRIQGLIKK